jgi:hypothetical protein
MPATGLQALILCGPGSSFPTFTSNPDENPKALLPIANRPMVWYPIDFCYRTGITSKEIFHECLLHMIVFFVYMNLVPMTRVTSKVVFLDFTCHPICCHSGFLFFYDCPSQPASTSLPLC